MLCLTEEFVRSVVSQARVTEAIEAMYVAIARGHARSFPVVREALNDAGVVFGFKSGIDTTRRLLGVKAGGYWPGNHARGLANHQSTVLLFDTDSGEPVALVPGNTLTALRTAAASAISIKHLARADARSLGIVGAGSQSEHQVRAALEVRRFERVAIADADFQNARRLAAALADLDVDCILDTIESVSRCSDVIITITPARAPVLQRSWVRPGTHIACMGADTRGKQELTVELVAAARCFVDDRAQAVSIGEMQHACASGALAEDDLVFIGEVLDGGDPGRTCDREITVFDSSGIGLQDIVAAHLVLDAADDDRNLVLKDDERA